MLRHMLRDGIKVAGDAPLTSTRPRAFLELLWIELPHVTLVATPSAAQLLKLQAPASLLRCFAFHLERVLERAAAWPRPPPPRVRRTAYTDRGIPSATGWRRTCAVSRAARMRRMAAASYCIFMWDLII